MVTFTEWLRATALSQGLQEHSWWLWPAMETLHFIGLTLVIGVAGLFDLRLMGLALKRVPVSAVKAFMPWAIAGFGLNLVTGVLFFITMPNVYVNGIGFWAKLFFLLITGLNAMLFETTLGAKVLTLGAGEPTPTSFKIVGGISLISWFAVLYFGRMLPYLGSGV